MGSKRPAGQRAAADHEGRKARKHLLDRCGIGSRSEAIGVAALATSAMARWTSCNTCGPWPADTSASALLAAEPGRRKLHRLFSLTDDVADGVGSGTDSTDLERH